MAELRQLGLPKPTPLDIVVMRRALRSEAEGLPSPLDDLARRAGMGLEELLEWGASSGDSVLRDLIEARHG